MLINASQLNVVHTQTDIIAAETKKLSESQNVLRSKNNRVSAEQDTMLSYMSGDMVSVFREVNERIKNKMELLCDVIEGTAVNAETFAKAAEQIDAEASEKIVGER